MLRMRLFVALISLGSSAVPAQSATAAEPDMAGRRLVANCAACHGTDGKPAADNGAGRLPPLAGQPREQLIASMQAFKKGERQATIMHQIARGYSDEQIALIASFLANQKKPEGR